jgi:DNA-binding response OmpR family regulator
MRAGLRFGEVEIDPAARLVFLRGERVDLSFRQYELTAYLIENAGIALSYDQLLDRLGGGTSQKLRSLITRLRRKLEWSREWLVPCPGYGYRLERPTVAERADLRMAG